MIAFITSQRKTKDTCHGNCTPLQLKLYVLVPKRRADRAHGPLLCFKHYIHLSEERKAWQRESNVLLSHNSHHRSEIKVRWGKPFEESTAYVSITLRKGPWLRMITTEEKDLLGRVGREEKERQKNEKQEKTCCMVNNIKLVECWLSWWVRACCQAWQPEFQPRDPCGGERTPSSCPQGSIYIHGSCVLLLPTQNKYN